MSILKAGVLLLASLLPGATLAGTIEVEVHGLSCAFCVDSLQRQLQKLPEIQKVDVSLKFSKIRIVSSDPVDLDRIREIVIDSGFTPVNIRSIEDEG